METEKKTYEISFLAKGEEAAGAVIKHLSQAGAEIDSEQQIEQVNLSYPIKKHQSAHFGCIHFSLDPSKVDGLKEALKFEEGLLRHMIVTPPISKEEPSQPRGPRSITQSVSAERTSPQVDTVSSNEDLEAKLEEISGSLDQET